jgi:hypothetical protein
MSLSALPSRIGPSLISVAVGWATATIITLPMLLWKLAVSSTGDAHNLLWSLSVGSLIWAAWTLAIVAGGWLLGFVPVIIFVSEKWLLGHPRTAIAIAAGMGWTVVFVEFQLWMLVLPHHTIAMRMFTLYSLLLISFPAVSAGVYLRRIRER